MAASTTPVVFAPLHSLPAVRGMLLAEARLSDRSVEWQRRRVTGTRWTIVVALSLRCLRTVP